MSDPYAVALALGYRFGINPYELLKMAAHELLAWNGYVRGRDRGREIRTAR
ncbi:hypothetical protein [Candidatus Poriferisocius sp.]|uniref:hypothetical protein n=1 Tax=Candidatus Poriferisocius sp. TaxID=3101276 RepID=UPI003B018408